MIMPILSLQILESEPSSYYCGRYYINNNILNFNIAPLNLKQSK